jgi:hypothetical protein
VFDLAESVGLSCFPTAEEGNVWCWGDDKGEFVTGVNRYVYEIYVKGRSPLVTKDKPWVLPLTGDLARVSTRGKAITIYLGSGHLIWMVKRYGNLWRFSNEGAESLNATASKRYNMFNNKGGYKSTSGYKAEEDIETVNVYPTVVQLHNI